MKLLAEWFRVDRWRDSSAFMLPIPERGLYREMLSQAWLRGARLPNDHEAIKRAIGATDREWRTLWPKIAKFWDVDGDSLVNRTQIEIYAEAQAIQMRASNRGKNGAQARWQAEHNNSSRNAQAHPEQSTKTVTVTELPEKAPEVQARAPRQDRPEARSKRVIFPGQRLVVFEWMFDDIRQVLGPYLDDFNLDEWFYALDAKLEKERIVLPKRDGGAWLQAQLLEECARRGLRIAGRNGSGNDAEEADQTYGWECRKCGSVHIGTTAEMRRGVCFGSGVTERV